GYQAEESAPPARIEESALPNVSNDSNERIIVKMHERRKVEEEEDEEITILVCDDKSKEKA
ncbi:18828_t:CDS:2, partial [Funneliformis geosporum]